MGSLSRTPALLLCLVLVGAGCARELVAERTTRGPLAQELLIARSFEANGRAPNFEEKRYWEDQLDLRISRYLREHPELQQEARFLEFRFWKQVTPGSTRAEVKVLLEEPAEQTIDPALLAALAEQHWPAIRGKATEAWMYPPAWVLYFDDKGIVDMVRRVPRIGADD